MTENTGGLDPDGWPALIISKLLYLDPTKPPFVWSSNNSEASDAADPSGKAEPQEVEDSKIAQRNMRKLLTVKLVVGTLSDKFRIRCITKSDAETGIALCSESGQLLEIIKASSITSASYRGDKLDLTIAKKNDPTSAQLFSFYFVSAKECDIFVHCLDRALKIKASVVLANNDSHANMNSPKRESQLESLNIKDTLIIEGPGYTESKLNAIYRESVILRESQQNRSKPLYPFLRVVWFISEQPGAKPEYSRQFTLDNTLEIELISAMAGRWLLVEGVLMNDRKKVSAAKGPVLPSIALSKRLLRTLVAGEGAFPVSIRADDLQYIISNLPDRYSLTFPTLPTNSNVPTMITCRFVITSKGLSIALPNDVLAGKGKNYLGYTAGEDLRLHFTWRECYLTLPEVYDSDQKTLLQSEFATGYRVNLEFYGGDQESWISTQIDFAKSEHRNIVWHYSMFMTTAELASSGDWSGTNALPELVTFLPQFERDLRIGNVQNVQRAFRLLWTALDYTVFKNSVQTPDMFMTSLNVRKEREAEASASGTNRAAHAKRDREQVSSTNKQAKDISGEPGRYMDGAEDPANALVEYTVKETGDKGLELAEWVSSSSSSANEEAGSDDS